MRPGRLVFTVSEVVDLDNHKMVRNAAEGIYEYIESMVLGRCDDFDMVLDSQPDLTLTEDDIADWLKELDACCEEEEDEDET